MRPVLIATPRSGSTIIGEQIGNLAEQWWGYHSWLNEYFSVSPYYRSQIVELDGQLSFEFGGMVDKPWCLNIAQERLDRRHLIDQDNRYMIKVMPGNFAEAWMVPWLKTNYDCHVFLDRRDRLAQLISWMAYRTVKVSHWHKNSTKTINKIVYNKEFVREFLIILDNFLEARSQFPDALDLYYEDWIDYGADQRALLTLLNWPYQDYQPIPTTTKPSPYRSNPEELIINKEDWVLDRPWILEQLSQKTLKNRDY